MMTILKNKQEASTKYTKKVFRRGGVPVVLTASAIEMSDFKLNPFIAFAGGFPSFFVRKKLYPMLPFNEDGTAKFAPYGLRKVEALLKGELGTENVVTVHPANLSKFVGPNTKIIGISTMDPLGGGFVSRTYTSILGLSGKPATLAEFEKLLSNNVFKKYQPRVILGGSGAWQIPTANLQDQLGIDHVLIGEAEHSITKIFRSVLNGERIDKVITMQAPNCTDIPAITSPSLYGTVEIMRGCGRGCAFCSATSRKRYSLPLNHILKEVNLNAKNGARMILLQTDDVFLYKSKQNFIPNRKAIVELIQSIDKVEGVEYLQIAHASLAPVVYDRKIVEEIAPILVEKSRWAYTGGRCASIEVGLETGSVRLMKKYMGGKMLPYKAEQWQDIATQSIGILNDNNINPLATLILGLPGETEEDIIDTIELLDELNGSKLFYVPLLFTSEEESTLKQRKHKDLKDLDELQWNIISRCWRNNINVWKPEINRKLALISFLLYPYYRLKHGKKVFKPITDFSGLGAERFVSEQKNGGTMLAQAVHNGV